MLPYFIKIIMWEFGNIKVNSKAVLAPMAGITFYSYRKFMAKFGVGLFYSEMVSDCGLIYENDVTLSYLKTDEDEHPFGIQLFGNNPDSICKAIDIIKRENCKCDFIDINLGCPVKKVTSAGSGSALLKDVDYLKDMMSKIVKHSHVPVTAKIRLGLDDNHINFLEVIRALEEAGVSLIAIHARTKKQLYCGKPNFEIMRDLRGKMHIPLVISGDMFDIESIKSAMEITGADAVMLARGAMGNPTLVKQVNQYYNGEEISPNATLEEQKKYCYELAKMIVEDKGEYSGIRIFRGIGPKFFNGFKNCKQVKLAIAAQIETLEDLKNVLDEYTGE